MGGNIWKDTSTRLEKQDYLALVKEIKDLFSQYGRDNFFDTKFVEEKSSFGDLDILVPSSLKDAVSNYISYLDYPINYNGDVISILYKNFQIDFIFIPDNSFEYSKHYFSWNDLGNFIGRVAKSLGFKHGHLGLQYKQMKGDRVLFNHVLSTNYYDILNILELDVSVFDKGFKTFNEMFEWVSSSPYFDSSLFMFSNLNNRNRVRDKKRKIYNMFLSFLESRDPIFPTKRYTLENILQTFPWLENRLASVNLEEEIREHVSNKFNGNLVLKLIPDINDLDIGNIIKSVKSMDNYSMFILNSSDKDIEHLILNTYKRLHND